MLGGRMLSAAAGSTPTGPVTVAGLIYAFGLNTVAQLGLNDTSDRLVPTLLDGNIWKEVSIGTQHTLAIKQDGSLWAWGLNTDGRTGLNTTTGNTVVPTLVDSGPWKSCRAGIRHSFGVKQDGTMWSWGYNVNGQLGLGVGDVTSRSVPTQVGTDTDWKIGVPAASGGDFSIAIKTNGTMYSMGSNASAQTGQNTTTGRSEIPLQIGTDTDWDTVSAGASWCAALKTNSTLWVWGLNTSYRTGRGTPTGSTMVPTQLGVATNWSKVSCGNNFGLAVNKSGQLYSWGTNGNGRTAQNTVTGDTTSPTLVSSGWLACSAGFQHGLGVKTDGTLWAWGNGNNGATGQNVSTGDYLVPTQIGTDTTWSSMVTTGNQSSFAILTTTFDYYATRFTSSSSQFLQRSGTLTGVSNSSTGIMSFWFKPASINTEQWFLSSYISSAAHFTVFYDSGNRFNIDVGSSGSDQCRIATNSTYTNTSKWYHVLISWDFNFSAGSRNVKFYIDGTLATNTIITDTGSAISVPYTSLNAWKFGAYDASTFLLNGNVSEVYFAPGQTLDFSNINNVRKFYSATGKPVYLGPTGSVPTGTQPAVYFKSPAASFGTNSGSGGTPFTVTNGPLTTSSDKP
jgi:alpha-tubulin suppressor-like RCC1 family protein